MNLQNIKNRYLQISIGLVYLWFGALKFFPNVSPAEELATNTINELTHFLIPSNIAIILLALWETAVGICFLLNFQKRWSIRIATVHMFLTFTPLYFFPELIFNDNIFSLTLVGQYIIKNLIILGALGVLWLETIPTSVPNKEKEKTAAAPTLGFNKLFRLRWIK